MLVELALLLSSVECACILMRATSVYILHFSFCYTQVVVGGGQEAMEVTTTSTRVGKFDARFFHLVFEEEFARVKGHFGPINTLAFHPDGRSFSSGGEDGFVRIQSFDPSYFEYKFDY